MAGRVDSLRGRDVRTRHFYVLIFIAVLALFSSCLAGSRNGAETKEQAMTFNLERCAYPVEFANYQHNSYVPAKVRRQWDTAWSRSFSEIDPGMPVSPRAVLVGDSIIAAKTASQLIVYDAAGTFKFMEGIRNPTPVVLGSGGMAYFNAAGGLVYQDYHRKKLRAEEPVPGLDQWAYALLIKPTTDEVLGVVQNAGIRGQREKKYYIYQFVRSSLTRKWSYEFPGIINHALLAGDEKTLVSIVGDAVTLYDADNGASKSTFKTGLANPLTASLNLNGELVIIGTAEDAQGAKKYCRAFSMAGKELWSIALIDPVLVQPPVSGEEGCVYLIDNRCLRCIRNGEVKWSTPPVFGARTCVTVTGGNCALVLDEAMLYLYDPAGERIFKSLISKEGDAFGIPPAVDARGKIYVLSDKRLYCLE
jgi:outer membrane protein assembly factor BamB